jgi:site-specific DNA recombinase
MKKGRICGIYIRCSSQEQSEKESLNYQENECKEYIKENKLAYYKTYKDIISGSSRHFKRPGMTDMFNDIKDGLIDAIVIQAADRLCRDQDATGEIVLFLKDNKVTLYQTSYDYNDNTFEGKTRKTIDRMMAQMELHLLSERTRLGMKSKMRNVGWVGGRVPFGYKILENNTNPVIDEEEAVTVKLIYNLYWDKNKTLKNVVKYLNNNKIKTGKYNKKDTWIGPSVARILRDHKEKYYGTLINNNQSGNKWGKILDKEYPNYPRNDDIN